MLTTHTRGRNLRVTFLEEPSNLGVLSSVTNGRNSPAVSKWRKLFSRVLTNSKNPPAVTTWRKPLTLMQTSSTTGRNLRIRPGGRISMSRQFFPLRCESGGFLCWHDQISHATDDSTDQWLLYRETSGFNADKSQHQREPDS